LPSFEKTNFIGLFFRAPLVNRALPDSQVPLETKEIKELSGRKEARDSRVLEVNLSLGFQFHINKTINSMKIY